jgi:hypothetical protein
MGDHWAFGRKAQTHPPQLPDRMSTRRADSRSAQMIPQSKNYGRSRPRPNASLNMLSAQAGQQTVSNQSQWQRKYDHYCNLAQASHGDDTVTREQHWQHAEHYLRLMNGSAS